MPTPRRRPGRTTIRGTRTDMTGTPTPFTSTPMGSIRAPTVITAARTTSTVTATGIARIATVTAISVTGILPATTGTTPPVTGGPFPDRASSPTGTVTVPAPGTSIRSTARAPTTVTDPDFVTPATAARSTPVFLSLSGRALRGSEERSRENSPQVHQYVPTCDISLS